MCRSDGIPCNQSVHWKTLSAMENRSQILVCPQSVDEGDKYFFQVKRNTYCTPNN